MQEHANSPLLVVYQGALAGNRWPVMDEPLTLGRAPDCDVVLPERQISRYHARIEQDEAGFIIRDLGSKNGTFVNGVAVRDQPYRLRDGDEIRLANVLQMGFVVGEATMPLTDLGIIPQGRLQVDVSARQVSLGRAILDPPLSPAQFALLELLTNAAGAVVTRDQAIGAVWPDAVGGVTDQALDALVYRLRERLTELDADYEYVVTVRGHGFRYLANSLF
ncbi:MAG: FHA domain-containing protein [Anaerolineae bacterium]|nr:FHA domain-containing protein [Anaerolineae bacterium]